MKLLVTSNGSVTWVNTRQVIVSNAHFAVGQHDFGAGAENTATCPGCSRTLPMVCMHLDHILSRSRHGLNLAPNSQTIALYDSASPANVSQSYVAGVKGSTVEIYTLGAVHVSTRQLRARTQPQILGTAAVIHFNTAWENDFSNLQFLCMSCNTSKGSRDFDQVFSGRNTIPLG